MSTKKKPDVYQLVTDRIVQALEAGTIPWHKTWSGGAECAQNYMTKRPYHGINAILTNLSPYDTPYFLTFKQAQSLGGNVRKGAKSLPIVFWKVYFTDGNNKPISEEEASTKKDAKKRFVLRYFSIFNIEDIEGIIFEYPKVSTQNIVPLVSGEKIVRCMSQAPKINVAYRSQAFYSPKKDEVYMPEMGQFETGEDYYSTLYHELIHATGHASRLCRPEVMDHIRFGTNPYAKEELVAEMGAAFLCQQTGMSSPKLFTNQAAYIAGWVRQFESDKRFVIQAATKARQAVEFILGQ